MGAGRGERRCKSLELGGGLYIDSFLGGEVEEGRRREDVLVCLKIDLKQHWLRNGRASKCLKRNRGDDVV